MKKEHSMVKRHLAIFGAFLLSALAVSCASAPNAFSEKRPKDGLPCSVTLTLGAAGSGGTFRIVGPFGAKTWLDGSASPDGAGGYLLEAHSFHWFSNWTDGWTEATFDASGKFTLAQNGGRWSLTVKEKPEVGEPLAAGIRYRDTVLDPQTAARQFQNRWVRILAASEFLRSSPLYANAELPPYSAKHAKDRGSTFVSRTGHYLFPEVTGYASEELKKKYEKTETAVSDDIAWRPAYSVDTFPESLRAVRDTGTLFRDWEESPELFYVACWHAEIYQAIARDAKVTVITE
jgi:hypothetical protein